MTQTSGNTMIRATAIGTVLQLLMVVTGHFVPAVAMAFGLLGMTISAVAGGVYGASAPVGIGAGALTGGAIVGGVCAFIGILVSFLLGDVTAMILAFGTLSSAVTGAIGGFVGRRLVARKSLVAG